MNKYEGNEMKKQGFSERGTNVPTQPTVPPMPKNASDKNIKKEK